MNIFALDKNFNQLTIGIPYTKLNWNRKYYEAGDFKFEIPIEFYNPDWVYIGSSQRRELGVIEQHLTASEFSDDITLGGFFYEKQLDNEVCYPRYIGDVQKTEQAVRNIFTKYKGDSIVKLGAPNDPLLGDRTQSDFSDDELGKKLYRILESRELSYKVDYDYLTNELELVVWQGLDRTQSQKVNSHQVFSKEFGNIAKRIIDDDISDYKNYAIIPCNADENGKEQNVYYLDWSNGGPKRKIVFDMRSSKPEEGQSMEAFKNAVLQEAAEKLLTYNKIYDIEVDPISDKGYMKDYDLGDKCDVVFNDLNIMMETRITEVLETFTADRGHTITVGLGNKRIDNVRLI